MDVWNLTTHTAVIWIAVEKESCQSSIFNLQSSILTLNNFVANFFLFDTSLDKKSPCLDQG